MGDARPTIFVSAAEASGDLHAANLIRALRRRLGDARFVGVAGPRMAEAGCEVISDLTRRASMLGAPLLRLGYYFRELNRAKKAIRDIRPDVHVPVDSPAINWHLAAAARKAGSPVCYYIAPQVWAWAPWRVRKLSRLTDEVACILPFEQRYLRHRGVRATYVGHPLFDELPERPCGPPDISEAWMSGKWRVALLPGSRPGEIKEHTRALIDVAEYVGRRWSSARCIFTVATEACAEAVRKIAGDRELEISVGRTRQELSGAHLAVAVSGTVTLEAAWFGVPLVIFYRTGRLLRLLRRAFGQWGVPTPHFSLVNILAGRRLVPELMPWNGRIKPLRDMVADIMDDLGYLIETSRDLQKVVDPLHVPPPNSASDNAAEIIVRTLNRQGR
ncbi:MAG: lipid-A-disaccharide synthase [Phycisphaerae bacterium]